MLDMLIVISLILFLFFYFAPKAKNTSSPKEENDSKGLSLSEEKKVGVKREKAIEVLPWHGVAIEATFYSLILLLVGGMLELTDGLLLKVVIIFLSIFYSLIPGSVDVPPNSVVIISFNGRRRNILLTEGRYSRGIFDNGLIEVSRQFIDSSRSPIDAHNLLSRGMIPINPIQWDVRNKEKDKSDVEVTALNGAKVTLDFKITFGVIFPLTFANTSGVMSQIFEETRDIIRSACSLFLSRDINYTQTAIKDLIFGKTVVAVVSEKKGTVVTPGTISRFKGGDLVMTTVREKETVEEAKERLSASLAKDGSQISSGEYGFKVLKLEENLVEALLAKGCELRSVTIADFQFSAREQNEVDNVAMEVHQMESELLTAKSAAKSRRVYIEAGFSDTIADAAATSGSGVIGDTINIVNSDNNKRGYKQGFSEGIQNGILRGNIATQKITKKKEGERD